MKPIFARYFNGYSIQPQQVELSVQEHALLITTPEESVEWPYEIITIIESSTKNSPCTIGNQNIKDARIIFTSSELYLTLLKHISQKNIQVSHVEYSWKKLSLVILLIIFIVGGLILGLPYFSQPISKIIPHEWDKQLGNHVVSKISMGKKECINEKGKAALQKMVDRLSMPQHPEHPFEVRVFDFDEINAFTAPGYHIVIMKGLIDSASSPDEVAGVLAHEMAHALLHHPTSGLISQAGLKIIIASTFGDFPEIGLSLVNFKYSRTNEFDADRLGVKILNDAHLSADGLTRFFETIVENYGEMDTFSKYFSTHPPGQERMQKVFSLNKMKNTQPVLTEKEFNDLRNICRKKEAEKDIKK